jgi:putative Mn2+ efflux pump MntP
MGRSRSSEDLVIRNDVGTGRPEGSSVLRVSQRDSIGLPSLPSRLTQLQRPETHMSPFAIAVLAIGMSVDALIASVGRGVGIRQPSVALALKSGLVFGIVETVTPLLGWAAGRAASQWVAGVDHWIAFSLLGAVGGHMAWQGLRRAPESETASVSDSRRDGSPLVLLATAFGTSIDAMAVGVSLAFLDVNILVIACAIGVATFTMSTGGMLAGRFIGQRFGRWAEMVGGVALVGLGVSILVGHLAG